jgi:large subunit ribosomal protein L3
MSYLLGRKLKMTQIWKGDAVVPATVLEVPPNKVSLVRTQERDGYSAVQLQLGRTKREFRLKEGETPPQVGEEIKVSVFAPGDKVRVSGTSKGRGFQGVVKRHGFGGGPKTHGQKNRLRAPGSIGSTAFQRVVPGRKMAGRMGGDRVTLKNLEVVEVDAEKNLLLIKGAVPGARGSMVEIQKI